MRARSLLLPLALSAVLMGCPEDPAPDGGTPEKDASTASPLERPPGILERPPARLPDDLRPPRQ